jgi:hypothetical protein
MSEARLQLMSAFQKALRPIDGVRQITKQALTREQHQRAKQARLLLRGSADGLLMNWWGEAPLSGAERARLAAMPPGGQDVVCRMLASRLAAQQPASASQLERLRSIAAACSDESGAAAFLRACCTVKGIVHAVLPSAREAIEQRRELNSKNFAPGSTPQIQRFVVAALADALRERGFRAGDVAWMSRQLEQIRLLQASARTEVHGELNRGLVAPHVMPGLRSCYERLIAASPKDNSMEGLGLLRLLESLRSLLGGEPEPVAPLPAAFKDKIRSSVQESFRRAATQLISIAEKEFSAMEWIGDRFNSDERRMQSRILWVGPYVGQATNLVIWCPDAIFQRSDASFRDSGLVVPMPSDASRGTRQLLPMFLRLDFRNGCLCLPLQRKESMRLEFYRWPNGVPLPIFDAPSQLRRLPRAADDCALGYQWQNEADRLIRSVV